MLPVFKMVSSSDLRGLQDTQANAILSKRLSAWVEDSGRRCPRHVQVQIEQQISDILGNLEDERKFKSLIHKLQQKDVFLLSVDCELAGELRDSILSAIQQASQEDFHGIFVVHNWAGTAMDSTAASLTRLLDNADRILDVGFTSQNFNAPEGKQLATPMLTSLKNILLDCRIQSDALSAALYPHLLHLQAMMGGDPPHPDLISAAVGHMVRDRHAHTLPTLPSNSTRILYTPDCDTICSPLLRKYMHSDKSVPGITQVTADLADTINACFKTTTDGSPTLDSSGLWQVARGMPASCVWAQTLMDLLHDQSATARRARVMSVVSGVDTPTVILSQFLASTLQHHEDLGAGALNVLVAGQPKLWVSLSDAADYDQLLEMGSGSSGSRDKKIMRSFDSVGVASEHISMFLQYSGLTVYTLTGHRWHQTLSLGTNIAESMNHWIGLEPATPKRLIALHHIASDLLAVSEFGANPTRSGWPGSYRSMAEAYFPDWELHLTLAEQVGYIETVLVAL